MMSHGKSMHKRLQEIVSEIRRLEKSEDESNQDYIKRLTREADKLQRKYQRYHGFAYNPLLYEGRPDEQR